MLSLVCLIVNPCTGINERDLILHRGEGEGFGFIIMSSANRDGAYIGQFAIAIDVKQQSRRGESVLRKAVIT